MKAKLDLKKKKKIKIFVSKSEFLESILWKYQEWTDYETKISYTSQEREIAKRINFGKMKPILINQNNRKNYKEAITKPSENKKNQ